MAVRARVIVQDRGIGIEEREAICSGCRAATARHAASSGIGLQLNRRLALTDGRQFWATTVPGWSNTFCLELPAAQVGSNAQAREAVWQDGGGGEHVHGRGVSGAGRRPGALAKVVRADE